jgi:hypothetical protein
MLEDDPWHTIWTDGKRESFLAAIVRYPKALDILFQEVWGWKKGKLN